MLLHSWSFIIYNAQFGKRGWGELSITSDPSGALLIYNGRNKGTTPQEMRFLRTGEYGIRLLMRDHQPYSDKINIEPGRKIEYHGILKKNEKVDKK
jgi:hypothetical protein